ncbi:DNA primase [Accumulibacter sp.]|uniref:DNA primase n=1 Tax=Accumulibacter sp. TaxID=2053492 RepID=UPI0025F69DA3|nr:DNA primase [Accumulibacter sp.]MCM8625670.1 DNA primase [Accumulibacter sp.]
MIPESFIQDLLSRVDVVDLIDAHVPLKRAGANFAACCPFHSEKSPSFTVSPSKQFYHCFGCGAHGTAIGFLMQYSGMGFIDAVRELAGRVGMTVPENAGPARGTSADTPSLVAIMASAARFYREQLKCSPAAIAYLKQRGVSGEIAARFALGYAPDGWQNLAAVFDDYARPELQLAGLVASNERGRLYDRFRDRLIFPIVSQSGEVIAFGGRVLGQGEPKYLNSPETPLFEKGRELFGLPQARRAIREHDAVLVVEGYLDVVALAQHGVANVVATLGTATTTRHVEKLLRQAEKIVFCFDGDAAGRKAAWRALENCLPVLGDRKSAAFAFLPEGEDPDSLVRKRGADAFRRIVSEAIPLSDFLVRELRGRCELDTAEGRARLVAEAKPLLEQLQSSLLRLQLVKRVAQLSGLSQAELESQYRLPSANRPASPRPARQAPSLFRPLLRLLLQKPELTAEIPLELLPDDSPEARAARELCSMIATGGERAPSCAQLIERCRGSEHEAVVTSAAAELIRHPFAEDTVDAEFRGVIGRLRESAERRSFALLQARAQRFGVSGLSDEEKRQYLASLASWAGRAKRSEV